MIDEYKKKNPFAILQPETHNSQRRVVRGTNESEFGCALLHLVLAPSCPPSQHVFIVSEVKKQECIDHIVFITDGKSIVGLSVGDIVSLSNQADPKEAPSASPPAPPQAVSAPKEDEIISFHQGKSLQACLRPLEDLEGDELLDAAVDLIIKPNSPSQIANDSTEAFLSRRSKCLQKRYPRPASPKIPKKTDNLSKEALADRQDDARRSTLRVLFRPCLSFAPFSYFLFRFPLLFVLIF